MEQCRLIPTKNLQSAYSSAKAASQRGVDDGRKVKFIYQELPVDGAFLTAQLAGNEVVYTVVLTKARNPLSREDVEGYFEGELSRSSAPILELPA